MKLSGTIVFFSASTKKKTEIEYSPNLHSNKSANISHQSFVL